MINKTNPLLKDQVYNKMKDLTFHTAVNKVLLGALPIDNSEMTRENVIAISTYSLKALESAGGFGLLEKAIENTKDPIKKNFLCELRSVCEESAMEVANRIAMEAEFGTAQAGDVVNDNAAPDSDTPATDNDNSGADPNLDDETMKNDPENDDTSIDDVKAPDDTKQVPIKPEVIRQGVPFKDLLADAKMTDKEYQSYVDKLGKFDLPEVSKAINERVAIAMKAEKETYRMVDEADQKLRDAIVDKADDEGDTLTEDQAEEIKESMLAVPLKNSHRDHLSLISKLQTAAIESLQISNTTNYDRIDPYQLLNITENYAIDGIFSHTEPSLEQSFDAALNLVRYQAAIESVIDPQQAVVLGTAMATVVYTLLQTLHSMNLVHITPVMVQRCCHRITPFEDRHPHGLDDFDVKVRSALEKQNRRIHRMNYAPDVESAIEELNHVRSKVYTARDKGFDIEDATVEAIENVINAALDKKNNLNAALEATLVPPSTSYGHSGRYLESDICSMNRLTRTFRNQPVDAIEFICTEGANVINVIGIKDGKNVKTTSIALEANLDVPTASYLKRLISSSNITSLSYGDTCPTITSYIDGNRTRLF